MYLKSIELSGFKSFAKKSSFTFNTPISAIVGPNGSGKSNVAESFRFVLGEQSFKSMRGKRGEDLIWNGSNDMPRAGMASVKVIFDNSRRFFDMDFEEVTIERTVHRDGVNEYFVNGSPVRLKDILELLARAHIGSSGHHIISQGEADRIISATPKERKAIVEDALGLKIYQSKKTESEKKLKKTFENIAQVEALRREIAPHLRFLKKQIEKLEKTEGLREELSRVSKEYFKREEEYLKETKLALESERAPLLDSLQKLEIELEEAKSVLAEAGQKEKKEYLILELEKELSQARQAKDLAGRELGKVEGLIHAQENLIQRQKELERSDEHRTISLKEVESLYKEIEKETESPGLLERIKERVLGFIRSRREGGNTHLVLDALKQIGDLQHQKTELEEKLKIALGREKKLDQEYESLKKDVEKAKDSDSSAQIAVFRIMSEENEVRSGLNMLKLREEKNYSENETFKRDLQEVAKLVGPALLNYHNFILNGSEERTLQEDRRRLLEKLRIRLEDASVAGSDEILKEFRETSERDEFLERELLDLEKSSVTLRELIKDLEGRLSTEFETGLRRINGEFEKLFSKMFDGGEAELVLVRASSAPESLQAEEVVEAIETPEAKTEEGLEIRVSLPRKKVRSLMMLSGGERALTSIALIFAISAVNPPPFIILDETDAALDEANSKKYGDMI